MRAIQRIERCRKAVRLVCAGVSVTQPQEVHAGVILQRGRPNELEFRPPPRYLDAVTATALIDQIKALPLDEQAKVIDALEELKSAQVPRVRSLDPKTFEQTTQRVFERHAALMQKLSQ